MYIEPPVRALLKAVVAHDGQKRKGSNHPYVTHPIRVAEIVSHFTDDVDVVEAAYLHDVLEDTDHTIDEFPERTQELVRYLTKRKKETKLQHVQRIIQDEDALLIKLADRYDNLTDKNEALLNYKKKDSVKESTDLLIKAGGNHVLARRLKELFS